MLFAQNDAVAPAPDGIVADTSMGDASQHLEHRFSTIGGNFFKDLTNSGFYLELGIVIATLFLAFAVGKYLRQKIEAQLAAHPPKHIDIQYISRPLQLLGVGITLPFLWVAHGIADALSLNGSLTAIITQLAYAYFFTTCVMLAVRQRTVAYVISFAIIVNAALHAARVSRVVTEYLDSVAIDAGQYHVSALRLLDGIIIFVVMFWGAGVLSRAFESYLLRATRLSNNTRHLAVKFFRIAVYFGAFVITLSAIGIDLTAFAIFSGALGVGIGLGLQKVTSNFVSGVTMLMERSIKIGDLVEVGGYTGWIRQLNIRYALLETNDGREVIIPNEELLSSRVVNWTMTTKLALIEIKAIITFDSDAEKAAALMLEAAYEHALCLQNPKANCWLREFAPTGISMLLTFWIADVSEGKLAPQSDVMFRMLKKFAANGITLAKG